MHFERRFIGSYRRTNLEHVSPEHLATVLEMIGVIFHERGSAFQTRRHYLHRANEGGSLPVALASKSIAVRHQALYGNTGQLFQSVQVFEIVRKRRETAFGEKLSQAQLNACSVQNGLPLVAALAQWFGHAVELVVFRCQALHL